MTAYLHGLRHTFDFTGRASRSQFWLYTLGVLIALIVGAVIDSALGFPDPNGNMPVTGLVSALHVIPSFAMAVRRLHDSDRRGWWMLISPIPFIGQIVLIAFACAPSTPGANRFGPQPGYGGDAVTNGHSGAGVASEAPGAASTAGNGSSPVHELERLASLRDSGAIDDAEFQRMKGQVLGQGSA
ncbi:DUF805 domain-containing protein [Pararhizobium mangrovi]|uniref:DUF805 domain-containing protein n=1 Tax=Pararhizobium mangrovi TaxID=2590452 RepID=A0A506TZD0_9HYPH|nr:DUF805 domain-containing protein [Pararhizobium mangrovi]TPW26558.1 DUF805 domain-containing protein [Pararhizobium mangrovi]